MTTAAIEGPPRLRELAPTLRPITPEELREKARGRIALILMALLVVLVGTVLAAAIALVRPFDRETIGLLLSGLLSPVVGLVGTVVGFYFGQQSVQQPK